MAILAVNAGSSSLKFSLHPVVNDDVQAPTLTGYIEGLEPGGLPRMHWAYRGERQSRSLDAGQPGADDEAFSRALAGLRALLTNELMVPSPEAVAHRVVHGGAYFTQSVIVTDEVMRELEKLNSLAPLHQPHNLAGIRALAGVFAGVPHIACFDTAFHASAPALHQQFALSASLHREGVRRYGFHGLSYHYIMDVLTERSTRAQERVLMAHLGNGASLCAALRGRSIASTMGFSALDGLMMGTRSGTLDPGVLLYLLEQGWDHRRIETLLYKQSGLLGVSGLSADMRVLRASNDSAAEEAIALFTHRVVRESGAMIACLKGLDVIAFSGGIGEHDALLREQVCAELAWMDVHIDHHKNRAATGEDVMPVHQSRSRIEVWVVPTDEGRVAAREAAALIRGRSQP